MRYCIYCGSKHHDNDRFCPECGKPVFDIDAFVKDNTPKVDEVVEEEIAETPVVEETPIIEKEPETIVEEEVAPIEEEPVIEEEEIAEEQPVIEESPVVEEVVEPVKEEPAATEEVPVKEEPQPVKETAPKEVVPEAEEEPVKAEEKVKKDHKFPVILLEFVVLASIFAFFVLYAEMEMPAVILGVGLLFTLIEIIICSVKKSKRKDPYSKHFYGSMTYINVVLFIVTTLIAFLAFIMASVD